MRRRHYLTLAGLGITGLTGCTGGDNSTESTQTTTSPSTTTTPQTTTETTTTEQTTTTTTAAETPTILNDTFEVLRAEYVGLNTRGRAAVAVELKNVTENRLGRCRASVAFEGSGTTYNAIPRNANGMNAGDRWKTTVATTEKFDTPDAITNTRLTAEEYAQIPDVESDLEVIDRGFTEGDEQVLATGTVENVSGGPLTNVSPEVMFRRDNLLLSGVWLQRPTELAAGEQLDFEMAYRTSEYVPEQPTDFQLTFRYDSS